MSAELFVEEHARTHLDLLVGGADPAALLSFAHGRGEWVGSRYEFPDGLRHAFFAVEDLDAALLVAEAAVGRGEDVYVCPHLRATTSAGKGAGWRTGRVAWVDLDDAARHDAVRRLVDAGGFAVGSGTPGHFHGYLLLSEPVPVAEVERVNRLLRDELGGDAKWAENSLLRLAGTVNFKHGELGNGTAPVRLIGPSVRTLTIAEVEALCRSSASNGSRKKAKTEPSDADVDRSARAMAYIGARVRQGLDVDGIVAELLADADAYQRGDPGLLPDAADAFYAVAKFGRDERLRADVERIAGKVREQLDGERGADGETTDAAGRRTIVLTPASSITPRPVQWVWSGRIACGTLALLGGREGIGKSLVEFDLAAAVTRGRLRGRYEGTPRAVIVVATEDSWEHTIVPRLLAAGADLDLVYRVDVTTAEGVDTGLCLPRDLRGLRRAVGEVGAVLILLDPLLSRLDASLDSHKDAEVRLALEPLIKVADDTDAAILGLIHVNKSGSTDPLSLLMGSRAFAAVARAVLFLTTDPDDESVRLLGQPKNNLGRTDLPTLTFTIESAIVAHTPDGPVSTGRVNWVGETDRSIRDVLESSAETAESRSAVGEAAAWLQDYLVSVGRCADSAKIKEEGKRAGHSLDALKRARARIRAVAESSGFPRRTYWRLPPHTAGASGSNPSGRNPGESAPTQPTAPTGQTGQGDMSSRLSGSSGRALQGPAPTGGGADGGVQQEPAPPNVGPCIRCGRRTRRYGVYGKAVVRRLLQRERRMSVEFAAYAAAVDTIAGHLADRDQVVVTGDVDLLLPLDLDRLAGRRLWLDNGSGAVMVAHSPETPRVVCALLPPDSIGAVLTIPKTLSHKQIRRVLGKPYDADGSKDVVLAHEPGGRLLWPRLFVDALALVDPPAAATLHAHDVRRLS